MEPTFSPSQLRKRACTALKGHWGNAAGITFVFCLMAGLASGGQMGIESLIRPDSLSTSAAVNAFGLSLASFVGGLWSVAISICFTTILGAGMSWIWLDLSNGKDTDIDTMFGAFKSYGRYLSASAEYFGRLLLWTLLLIIPGIIKQYAYAMTYYIMRERPELTGSEAIKLSERMMKGHKGQLFVLQLSFIGWGLLAVLSCGIGFLWLAPYMQTATAEFYKSLKATYSE